MVNNNSVTRIVYLTKQIILETIYTLKSSACNVYYQHFLTEEESKSDGQIFEPWILHHLLCGLTCILCVLLVRQPPVGLGDQHEYQAEVLQVSLLHRQSS